MNIITYIESKVVKFRVNPFQRIDIICKIAEKYLVIPIPIDGIEGVGGIQVVYTIQTRSSSSLWRQIYTVHSY